MLKLIFQRAETGQKRYFHFLFAFLAIFLLFFLLSSFFLINFFSRNENLLLTISLEIKNHPQK
jgi:hypothetical protein